MVLVRSVVWAVTGRVFTGSRCDPVVAGRGLVEFVGFSSALVAQLDRASASEVEGYRFDPCRGYLISAIRSPPPLACLIAMWAGMAAGVEDVQSDHLVAAAADDDVVGPELAIGCLRLKSRIGPPCFIGLVTQNAA